jgi:hypothetical protein
MTLTRCLAFAFATLLVSPLARADEEHATPAELGAFVKSRGAKLGGASKSTLESPDFVDVKIKKGWCYTVEVKLDPGARWKAGRRASMFFPDWQANPLSVGPTLIGETGAIYEPSCAEKSGMLSFGLNTFGPEDKVGSGGYTLQVYERKPAAKELAAERAMMKKVHEDSIRERDAGRQKTCGACAGESSSSRDRKICLERRGLTMSDCGW